jgi:uncharacterized membrane protein
MSRFPWRTLLFISVALNLLIVGAVTGAFVAGVRLQRQAGEAVVDRMPGPRAFLRAMPPDTRALMRRELADSWDQSRQARASALQARREAFEAVAAEPYDAERVRAAFERLREADQRAIGVFHDNIADAFGRLTPAERRQALDALRTAAPARRQGLAPQEDASAASGAADQEAQQTRREKMREIVRERRRERRERAAPPAP